MINAFPKSRCVAWTGGAVLGAAAGISAWLYMAGRAASLFNRAIVALLATFIAVNIALYIARLMAAREYQKRLLLLYEALDPSAFLQALLPLRKKRMDASNRCTTLVHIANGYLYGGQPQQALAVLEDVQPAGEGAGDAGSCGRQQSYLLSGGGRDGSGADSPWTSCGALQQTGTAKRNSYKRRAIRWAICSSAWILPGEGTQMWERFKRILRAAVHRCTGWMCSTVSHWRCATGATGQAWRKAANISLRTVAVPATASLRVHFDTCERYKKARPEASLPRALRSYRKVYFFHTIIFFVAL